MAYCVEADVRRQWNSSQLDDLASDDGDGAVDGTLIDDLIDQAGRKIFKYVKGHHSDLDPEVLVAGTNVPIELRDLCAELVVWLLLKRQGHLDQDEWDRIMGEAKDIGNGTATIASPTTRIPDSTVRGRPKEFSDKTLRRYGEPPRGAGDADLNDAFDSGPTDTNDFP